MILVLLLLRLIEALLLRLAALAGLAVVSLPWPALGA